MTAHPDQLFLSVYESGGKMDSLHWVKVGVVRWWNGFERPFSSRYAFLPINDPDLDALRISIRRGWVVSSLLGILIIVFGWIIWADQLWSAIAILIAFALIVVPSSEEPSVYLYYMG